MARMIQFETRAENFCRSVLRTPALTPVLSLGERGKVSQRVATTGALGVR